MKIAHLARLLPPLLLVWVVSGWYAWFVLEPGRSLVGVRSAASPLGFSGDFAVREPGDILSLLKRTSIWGVQRDGKPLLMPQKTEETEKKIEWQVIASVARGNGERLVVIRIDGKSLQSVKEGETLPDGSLLLKVSPASLSLRDADGEERVVITYVE